MYIISENKVYFHFFKTIELSESKPIDFNELWTPNSAQGLIHDFFTYLTKRVRLSHTIRNNNPTDYGDYDN